MFQNLAELPRMRETDYASGLSAQHLEMGILHAGLIAGS